MLKGEGSPCIIFIFIGASACTHTHTLPETVIPRRICVILFTYISTDGDHVSFSFINFFHFGINVHQKTGAKVLVAWQGVFGRKTFVSSTND